MPAEELVVRAATPADRGAAIRLLTAQLVEHALPADPDGVARGVELALAHGSSAWMVLALVHGLPAGILLANPIVSVEHGGAALWIEELYVVPERRRRGVARALLRLVVDEARANGMRAVELEVVPTQAAALALYASLGFQPVDRRRIELPIA
jgi:ribosomal protein S18 acetylase RimI-like enzyme